MGTAAPPAHNKTVWSRLWPVILLSLLVGTRWVLDEDDPGLRSGPLSAALGSFMAALVIALASWPSRAFQTTLKNPKKVQPSRLLAWLAGTAILAGPVLCSWLAGRRIGGVSATLALALTPVIATVAAMTEDLGRRLWPGLAALSGLLLLLPEPNFASPRLDVALFLMPLALGLGSIGVQVTLKPTEVPLAFRDAAPWMTACLFCSALLQMLAATQTASLAWHRGLTDLILGALLDGTLASISLWALVRAGAEAWSSQFFLAPLITILEGVTVDRPTLSARAWLGLILVTLGSTVQLVRSPKE